MSIMLNASVIENLSLNARNSRAIWIDIEPDNGTFALVLRGDDPNKMGATLSKSDRPDQQAKQTKPALFWNDESAAARRYVLATFPDRESADLCALQLIDFYDVCVDMSEEDRPSVCDRIGALGADARELLPVFLLAFGAVPTGEQSRENRIGTFADYLAGKSRPRKARGPKNPARALESAGRALENEDIRAALVASGATADQIAALAAIFSKAQSHLASLPTVAPAAA